MRLIMFFCSVGAFFTFTQASAQAVDQTVKGMDKTTPPRLIKQVDPKFPKKLRKEGKTYSVVIHFVISTQGLPVNPVVSEPSPDEDLNRNALEAVSKYRFAPALSEGKPVAVEMNVTVNFGPIP